MNNFSNKLAIITGASSGIGLDIAHTLLQKGCQVIGIARDFSKCDINHKAFKGYEQDLSDLNKTDQLIKKIAKEPPVDFFIHCAGSGLFGSVEQFSAQQIDKYIKSNLSSAIVCAHQIIPIMRKNKSGKIIFMGSESSLKAGKKGALYSSAKFGLRGLALSLREDCGKDNIAVSIINPGMVRTPFFDQQSFKPGIEASNAIDVKDISNTVIHILESDSNIVFDEINISPRNKSIDFN